MANSIYLGVDDAARKVKTVFIGVDKVARPLKKIYVGDANGKARLVFEVNKHTHYYGYMYEYSYIDDASHVQTAYCSCGNSISTVESHNNMYESSRTPSTCTDKGTVYYRYGCCDVSAGTSELPLDPDNHTKEPNVLDTSTVRWATCAEEGYAEMLYECCGALGATLTLPINPDKHEKLATLAYKAPTCTEHGNIAAKNCNGCHKWFDNDGNELSANDIIIDALGHEYESVVTDPTCTEKGYTTHTCTRCGHSYVDSYVDALGHDYKSVVTEATCTAQGYTTYTCSKCGDSYKSNYRSPLGHATLSSYSLAPDTFGAGTGVYVEFQVNRGNHSDISSVTVIVRSSSGGDTTYNVSLDSEGYGYVTVYANWATGAHDVYVKPGCCSSHEIYIGSFNYDGKNDIYS